MNGPAPFLASVRLSSNSSPSRTAGPSHPLNLPFTVRSGTTRMRHREMAEFALARSSTDANPQIKPMDPLGRATKIPPRPLVEHAMTRAQLRRLAALLLVVGVAMMGAVFGLWLLWLSQPVF
jgi:hypothetical protein